MNETRRGFGGNRLAGVAAACLVASLGAASCGGSAGGDAPRIIVDDCPARAPASSDIADRLAAAPCVASVTELTAENAGYRAFDVRLTQFVQHDDPASGTFAQQMTIQVRDENAPTTLFSTGYDNYWGQRLSEVAELYAGNQIVVEHRYFGTSIPADPDWTKLTIANSADDYHQIVAALRPILKGAWISEGGSKGGETSVFHRRFWPDDVDGVMAYSAPISFGLPDYRYDAYLDEIGPPACRQALKDLQVELLDHRRAMLAQRAADEAVTTGHAYSRVAIAPAVESAVATIYWDFWQFYGVSYCSTVPPVTASDDDVWKFVAEVAPVSGLDDESIVRFQPFNYQVLAELGAPGTNDAWLDGHLEHGGDEYAGAFPTGVSVPRFHPDAMEDIDDWVQSRGSRLLFLYGQWDPWTAGAYRLGHATDAAELVVPAGNHLSLIADLPAADREAAIAKLTAWTGVAPVAATPVAAAATLRSASWRPRAIRSFWRARFLSDPSRPRSVEPH